MEAGENSFARGDSSTCVTSRAKLGVMALVRVLSPDTEPELVTAVALLEAHDIPCFVHGAGLGSLWPGAQVPGYNTRTIMVPEENVADALELLRDFQTPPTTQPVKPRYSTMSRLRALLEVILFGWFVPAGRAERTKETDTPPGT